MENTRLKQRSSTQEDFIGDAPPIQKIKQIVERVAPTNSRVLLTGPAGTGKDLLARMLHKASPRVHEPFLVLNCANLDAEHLDDVLFGQDDEAGLFEQADNGTLLLDQISDMPLDTQGKITRVLQEQSFKKKGSSELVKVDVRILASSHDDLQPLVDKGAFREDLFYRLNVVPIKMPALKDRMQDLPLLISYLSDTVSAQSGQARLSFSEEAILAMKSYDWPGNVRQLRNVIEWVQIMHADLEGDVEAEHLPNEIRDGNDKNILHLEQNERSDISYMTLTLRDARENFERLYLQSQIDRFDGNISQTAKFIGMERSALHRKLKALDIICNDKEERVAKA